MRKNKILLTVLSVIMIISMLATAVGCSKKPKTDGPLQIIATNETYKELFDKFTADTGIKYEMLSMSSGAVLSKLQAEGANPTFDVWFGGGINDFINAKDLGYLQKVDFKAIKDLNPLFVDKDHQYFSKGMTIVGFAVNNDIIKEKGLKSPATWDDIIDPKFNDEIVFSDPSVSGTCYAVLYALMQKKGEDYVKKFADNILYLGSRGKDPIEKTVAGECAVGITYIDGTLDGIIGDANVSIVYPTDGIPWTPEGVAAIKNSPNAKAGAYFIEWLYSDDANLQLLAKIDKKGAVKAIKPGLKDVELDYDADFLYDLDLTEYASKATEYKNFFAGLFK
ncbi:MAG: extracellular solute-binding protein [Dehalococcoidales bacterium]|nr:extracellular solute-binding protein [Dehalococcoidales bacterium]